jgi:hypothetical protein
MFRHRSKVSTTSGAAVGDISWRAYFPASRVSRAAKQPLSLRETISRASLYAVVIAILWGVAYFLSVHSGVRWL